MKEKFEIFKNEKIVVNVRSQKQYDDFMKLCEEQGSKWNLGELPTKPYYYHYYEEETCINLNNLSILSYCNINYYKNDGYKIITYEDFIKEESNQFTKSDLKDNHIVKVIDLLSKLEKNEIPNKTKFKWRDSIVINKKGTLYCNDMFFSKILNFGNAEALKEELEIIEEDKQIEKLIQLDIRETSDCIIKIQAKINKIIDEVNKLEEGKK